MIEQQMQPLIFPVGHYLGELYEGDSDRSVYRIRLGWDVIRLDSAERETWNLARGGCHPPCAIQEMDPLGESLRILPEASDRTFPEPQVAAGCTRSQLVGRMRNSSVWDSTSLINDLVLRELLVEVVPDTLDAVNFAGRFRLLPLGLGFGNCQLEPGQWRIGSSAPKVAVDPIVFRIWQWGHMFHNLWEACQGLPNIDREDRKLGEMLRDVTPESVLRLVLGQAHGLLAASCAYFDLPTQSVGD